MLSDRMRGSAAAGAQRTQGALRFPQCTREAASVAAIADRVHGTEPPEVVRHRVLIAARYGQRIHTADLTGLLIIETLAQLQFQRVQFAEQLLMNVLDHLRVAGKAPEIQMLHLADQL